MNLLWPQPCSVMLYTFQEVRYRVSQKKYSENFSDYFPSSNDRMTESESAQKLFYTNTGHNKPCIEEIGVFVIEINMGKRMRGGVGGCWGEVVSQ